MQFLKISDSCKNNYNQEIINLLTTCFKNPKEFFAPMVNSNIKNCFLCIEKNVISSVLFALPQKLKLNNKVFDASYVYAACTHPKYRKMGQMTALLNYVFKFKSLNSKDDFLFLAVEDSNLKGFYERVGFRNFFKYRNATFYKHDIEKILMENQIKKNNSNFVSKNIENTCRKMYNDFNGVLYDYGDFKKIADMYNYVGGRFLTGGYFTSLCIPEVDRSTLKVYTVYCEYGFEKNFICDVNYAFPNFEKYVFRFPIKNCFLKADCICDGMVLPTNLRAKNFIKNEGEFGEFPPYIALCMN